MVGKTISHYEITAKLGEGGMGVVYRAEDIRLHRKVALKCLRPEAVESEELKARFLHEARAAAALDHPNICTVYEIDEAEGVVFLTMAYVEGQSLRKKISGTPMKLAEALDIAIQAAEGLQAAHEKNIVHRDIKSANIMVTPRGQVKITDFGLAQVGGRTKLTRTGTTLGTPSYMSPEQAQSRPADRRSDIWSLGVVVYEMATGRLPFEGGSEQAVLYSIVHEAHEPITALRVGVPPELDRIVGKAMAKSPEERYQHVDEMLVDLRALRKTPLKEPVPVRPRRNKIALAAAGALIALLALVIGLDPGGLRDRIFGGAATAATTSVAVLPLENLSGDPEQNYLGEMMTEALINDLSKVGSLRVITRRSVMAYKDSEKPLPVIAEELGVDTVVEGSVVSEAGRVRVTAQLIETATDRNLWAESYERDTGSVLALMSEVAAAVAGEIKGKLTPLEEVRLASGRPRNPEVHQAYLRGMFYLNQSTPEGFQKGMEYLHQAVEADPADPFANAMLALGYATLGHGGASPQENFPLAKAAATKALGLDETLAEAHAALADVQLYYDWDWAGAEQSFRRALELNPNLAVAHHRYGWYLQLIGQPEQAIAELRLAQELDPLTPIYFSELATLYWMGGRYDLAIEEADKGLELNPGFPPCLSVLGFARAGQGTFEGAIDAHRRAATASPAWRWTLAYTYVLAGQPEEARTMLAQLQEGASTEQAWGLAAIHTALGEKDQAFRELDALYQYRHNNLPWLDQFPIFEPLHEDRRFQELVDRMSLPR